MSITNRINRVIKEQNKKIRKAYIRKMGVLAQQEFEKNNGGKKAPRRKYNQWREHDSRRGMDGTLRG